MPTTPQSVRNEIGVLSEVIQCVQEQVISEFHEKGGVMVMVFLLIAAATGNAIAAPGSYSGNVGDLLDSVSPGDSGLWIIPAFLLAGLVLVLFLKLTGIGGWKDAGLGEIAGMTPIFAVGLFILAQVLMFSFVMWPLAIIVAWVAYGRWKNGKKKN